MIDWMVEVCGSFKFRERTYFLAVALFDKYLLLKAKQGKCLSNQEVHAIGVTAMYTASKYEDLAPIHSKIVSDKITHNTISRKEIKNMELEMLQDFSFSIDFVTPLDFTMAYYERIEHEYYKCTKVKISSMV